MLTLLVAVMVGQADPVDRPPPLRLGGLPAFYFVPSAVCTCTMPTDARGNAMQGGTRAGDATCTPSGIQTTGIASESLVVCTANQPRIERHANGLVGFRQEAAGTNRNTYSEAPDNAAWTKENSGAVAPAFDAGVGPKLFSGGTNSTFVSFAATSGVQYSDFYQAWSTTVAGYSPVCSWYVRGVEFPDGGVNTGTTDTCSYDGATWSCTPCEFTSASWTRCASKRTTGTSTSRFCKYGNNSNQNGGVARTASNVYVACMMSEENVPGPSSCVPTTIAYVNRAADSALYLSLDAGILKGADGLYSFAFVVSSLKTSGWPIEYAVAGTNTSAPYVSMYTPGANVKCESHNGATVIFAQHGYIGAPDSTTLGCFNDGANEQGWTGTTAFSTPGAGTRSGASINRVNIGTTSAGYEPAGLVGPVCFDPNPNRCRSIFP